MDSNQQVLWELWQMAQLVGEVGEGVSFCFHHLLQHLHRAKPNPNKSTNDPEVKCWQKVIFFAEHKLKNACWFQSKFIYLFFIFFG